MHIGVVSTSIWEVLVFDLDLDKIVRQNMIMYFYSVLIL